MKIFGFSPIAILVAAIAVYAVGLIIYVFVVPAETWMEWSGISLEAMETVGMARMPLSPIMPIMIAIGTAMGIQWRGAQGISEGAMTGLLLALFFLVGGRLYGYVYGVEGLNILALDSVHLLLNGLAAGAALGWWAQRN